VTLGYLLDTNVVSDPISKSPNAGILEQLGRLGNQCAIAAPVWHELQFGCRRLPVGKRRRAIESYLLEVVRTSFPILAYDEAAAARHALERGRLEQLGTPCPFVDGQMAAIAQVHELVLVTRNRKDFTRYANLVVEDWTA
jgi:tRNA(fMet)-specific endonuclease VapC